MLAWNDITRSVKRRRYFWNYGNQGNAGLSLVDTVGCNSNVPRREMIQFDRISRFRIRPAEKLPGPAYTELDIARDFSNFLRSYHFLFFPSIAFHPMKPSKGILFQITFGLWCSKTLAALRFQRAMLVCFTYSSECISSFRRHLPRKYC